MIYSLLDTYCTAELLTAFLLIQKLIRAKNQGMTLSHIHTLEPGTMALIVYCVATGKSGK